MDNPSDIFSLCRLCLVKDQVNISIFDEQGDIRQIFLKISSCLPIKVSRDDKLPKKICDDCSNKLDLLYEFWNSSANAEKTLLSWLGQAGVKDAGGTINAVAQQIAKPTETLVKLESGVVEGNSVLISPCVNNVDNESFNELPKEESEAAPPPPKRTRRSAAVKAQINIIPESEDDDDIDTTDLPTKLEDGPEDSDAEDKDPSYTEVPGTSANDQPGPSGVGKAGGVEAPIIIDDNPTNGLNNEEILSLQDKVPALEIKQEKDALIPLENNMENIGNIELVKNEPNDADDALISTENDMEIIGNSNIVKTEPQDADEDVIFVSGYKLKDFKQLKVVLTNVDFSIVKAEVENFSTIVKTEIDDFSIVKREIEEDAPVELIKPKKPIKKLVSWPVQLCEKFTQKLKKFNSRLPYSRKVIKQPNKLVHFFCEICKNEFSCFRRYWNHKILMHSEHKFNCAFCDKVYQKSNFLLYHTKIDHPEVTKSTIVAAGDNNNSTIYCESCGLGFLNILEKVSHIEATHKSRYLVCSYCKDFSTNHVEDFHVHFNEHKQIKPSLFNCTICSKNFYFLHVFINHLYNSHNSDEECDFKCKICRKNSKSCFGFRSHLEKHLSIRPQYFCFICNKYFRSNQKLEWHIKAFHPNSFECCKDLLSTGEKNEDLKKCYWCGKSVVKSSRKIHLRTHTRFWDEFRQQKTCKICLKSIAKFLYRPHTVKHLMKRKRKQKKTKKINLLSYGITSELFIDLCDYKLIINKIDQKKICSSREKSTHLKTSDIEIKREKRTNESGEVVNKSHKNDNKIKQDSHSDRAKSLKAARREDEKKISTGGHLFQRPKEKTDAKRLKDSSNNSKSLKPCTDGSAVPSLNAPLKPFKIPKKSFKKSSDVIFSNSAYKEVDIFPKYLDQKNVKTIKSVYKDIDIFPKLFDQKDDTKSSKPASKEVDIFPVYSDKKDGKFNERKEDEINEESRGSWSPTEDILYALKRKRSKSPEVVKTDANKTTPAELADSRNHKKRTTNLPRNNRRTSSINFSGTNTASVITPWQKPKIEPLLSIPTVSGLRFSPPTVLDMDISPTSNFPDPFISKPEESTATISPLMSLPFVPPIPSLLKVPLLMPNLDLLKNTNKPPPTRKTPLLPLPFEKPKFVNPNVCSGCEKKFINPKIVAAHEIFCFKLADKFNKLKFQICPLCNNKIATFSTLKQHMFQVHSRKLREYGLVSSTNNDQNEIVQVNFECKSCRKRFKNKGELAAHEVTHQIEVAKSKPSTSVQPETVIPLLDDTMGRFSNPPLMMNEQKKNLKINFLNFQRQLQLEQMQKEGSSQQKVVKKLETIDLTGGQSKRMTSNSFDGNNSRQQRIAAHKIGCYKCAICATLFTNFSDYIAHKDTHTGDDDMEENYLTPLESSSSSSSVSLNDGFQSTMMGNSFTPNIQHSITPFFQPKPLLLSPPKVGITFIPPYSNLPEPPKIEFHPPQNLRINCQVCSQEFSSQENLDYHFCPGPF